MRIALELSGQPRYLLECFADIWTNLIVPYNPDIFIHAWTAAADPNQQLFTPTLQYGRKYKYLPNHPILIERLFQPVACFLQTPKMFSTYNDVDYALCNPQAVHSQLYSIMCASYLRQAHERRNCFIYDRVIRCRTDLQFCNSDFSINSFLEPNTVCVSPTGNIPPGPNDQFAYGPSGAMAIWASTYKYLHLYHTQGFKLFTGEPLIAHHCKTNNVYIQILRAEKVFTRPYGTPFLPRIEDI